MTHKGRFIPKNLEKYVGDPSKITYRSNWERKFMQRCDTDNRIIKWQSEGHPIPYRSDVDGKMHRYYIDFFIQTINKENKIQNIAIEIKPFAQTQPPKAQQGSRYRYISEMKKYSINQSKWKAARDWATLNNFQFIILTEHELGL